MVPVLKGWLLFGGRGTAASALKMKDVIHWKFEATHLLFLTARPLKS